MKFLTDLYREAKRDKDVEVLEKELEELKLLTNATRRHRTDVVDLHMYCCE